jgi:uncharacterized cupredoxin-like copper-binding protein
MNLRRSVAMAVIVAGVLLAMMGQRSVSAQDTESTVAVSLGEWFVAPDAASVPTGSVTFNLSNDGTIPHELLVIALNPGETSDPAVGDLPIGGAGSPHEGRVDEESLEAEGRFLGEIESEQLPAGGSASLTLTLAPGTYALICNIEGHYAAGMWNDFTVTAAGAPTAPGSGSDTEPAVAVSLGEWFVAPDAASVPTGSVTFNLSNDGTIPHELLVIALNPGETSDPAVGDLPIGGAGSPHEGRVDEESLEAEGRFLGEVESEGLPAGGSASLTLTLAPGTYALICNIEGHYAAGMWSDFTVTAGGVMAPAPAGSAGLAVDGSGEFPTAATMIVVALAFVIGARLMVARRRG